MSSQSDDDDNSNSTVSADVSTCFGVFIIITIIYTIVKIIFGVVGDRMWIFGYLLI